MQFRVTTTLLLAGALFAGQAQALMFDEDVTHDVIYGTSGNANGGWTVDRQNDVEVGLRTHQRVPTPDNIFNSNGDGTYSWGGGTAGGGFPKALWNLDFAININLDGSTPAPDWADFEVLLDYDTDMGAGINFVTVDVKTHWADNQYGDTSTANSSGTPSAAPIAGTWIMQNSQNIAFGEFSGGLSKEGPATWDFRLRVLGPNGELASTNITVLIDGGAVVSEPATLGMLGLSLLGMGAVARRRRRS